MKLLVAIVQDADARRVLDALVAEGHRATKISSTGGFLVRGNTTILIGVEDQQVNTVFDILREHCVSVPQRLLLMVSRAHEWDAGRSWLVKGAEGSRV